jgi:hypothetical protein
MVKFAVSRFSALISVLVEATSLVAVLASFLQLTVIRVINVANAMFLIFFILFTV